MANGRINVRVSERTEMFLDRKVKFFNKKIIKRSEEVDVSKLIKHALYNTFGDKCIKKSEVHEKLIGG